MVPHFTICLCCFAGCCTLHWGRVGNRVPSCRRVSSSKDLLLCFASLLSAQQHGRPDAHHPGSGAERTPLHTGEWGRVGRSAFWALFFVVVPVFARQIMVQCNLECGVRSVHSPPSLQHALAEWVGWTVRNLLIGHELPGYGIGAVHCRR